MRSRWTGWGVALVAGALGTAGCGSDDGTPAGTGAAGGTDTAGTGGAQATGGRSGSGGTGVTGSGGVDPNPPSAVGEPCIPGDEYQSLFSGYSIDEVNIETRSYQCETRICLANHFQGRVSCPYGQTEAQAAEVATAASWEERCALPGTDGSATQDRVEVPVAPQKHLRQANDAVYCSCRCMNGDGRTDDGPSYCECPDGFSCVHLVDDIGLGGSQLAGGYCIKTGTEYGEAEAEASPECVRGVFLCE